MDAHAASLYVIRARTKRWWRSKEIDSAGVFRFSLADGHSLAAASPAFAIEQAAVDRTASDRVVITWIDDDSIDI